MKQYTLYSIVEPDSQMFGSLENILTMYKYEMEEYNKDYILTGIKNTYDNGGILVHGEDFEPYAPFTFTHLKSIIAYLEGVEWDGKDFIKFITSTLHNGWDIYLPPHKNKFKMKKKKVYKRVDGELEYQELKWVVRRDANGTPDESKPPSEWVNYMQHHMNEANKAIYHLEDEEALAEIRKIVALGVRALMIHGCPKREIPEELLNGD